MWRGGGGCVEVGEVCGLRCKRREGDMGVSVGVTESVTMGECDYG